MKKIPFLLLCIALSCIVSVCAVMAALPMLERQAGPTETAEMEAMPEKTEAAANLNSPANVLDYGADPTGHEDSTVAVKEALRHSKHVYFPAGAYLIDRLTISGSVTLSGDGHNCSVIRTSNLTDHVITFRDSGWHVRDLKFDAVSNRTDGAYIFSGGDFASVENVSFNRQYVGVDLDGSWSVNLSNITAYDGTPHEIAPGGAIIRLGKHAYTGPIHIRGLTAKPSGASLQPSSGIWMGYVDVVSISDALIIWHRNDIEIAPSGRQFAALVEITNSCLDTAAHGIVVAPESGARVLRCGVANTWFGAHTSDAAIMNGSDGTVTGLQFTNCMFLANGGDGVKVSGQGVDGLYFSNSFSGGNRGCGLSLSNGAQNVFWTGGVLGACHELNGNAAYGYHAEAGCSGRIALADLTGNGAGAGEDAQGAIETFENMVE